MISLRQYTIQETRHQWFPFFGVDRVDYNSLLDTLHFPVLWFYDEYLTSWLPAEVDYEFLGYLPTVPPEFIPDQLPKGRYKQLCQHGLIAPPRSSYNELQDLMGLYGHCKIQNLLHPEYCKTMLKQYYWRNEHKHDRWNDLEGIKRTSCNNMPLMRLLHQATEGLVRIVLSQDVKTSYSFTSAYESGTCLPAHKDRPQCVYNISFMLGSDPPNARLSDWPLFIQRNDQAYQVNLEAGDGVLYSGVRDLHWRNYMPQEIASTLGVFFHYVPGDFTGSLD